MLQKLKIDKYHESITTAGVKMFNRLKKNVNLEFEKFEIAVCSRCY